MRYVLSRRRLRRQFGLRSLGPDFGYGIAENTAFEPNCRIGGPAYIAGSHIGAFTYIEVGSRISLTDVGRFCSIAPYCIIGLAEHPTDFVSTHPAFYRHLPAYGWDLVAEDQHHELTRTTVGSDVWIGAGAVVKGGVTIGHGAIIGAGAVVTRDVPPYAIVGGVPAQIIRYRFDPAQINDLLESRWWERDLNWLRTHAADMRDVAKFIEVTRGRLNSRPR
ncbi:CatB-related O-acetyltransferase [Phytoactinopolyspora halotolerans]|uniref:CatB-related O-acetyltransferase n=1 Tax=Phytoactinopolyspora halotolerans TaxID=1981512 RepID=UPI0028A80C0E|nr:CatB-related O-acetyltransferase [Phytoactinopolyspora halotolerans]